MAVAHKILVIIYHVLRDGTFYDESRDDRHDAREEERDKQRALAALARLGYAVTLSPVRETAPDCSTSVGCAPLVVSVWRPKRRRRGIGAPMRRKNFVGKTNGLLAPCCRKRAPRGHPTGAPVGEPAPGLCVWWRHTGGGAHYACGSVCPAAGRFVHDCDICRKNATDETSPMQDLPPYARVVD